MVNALSLAALIVPLASFDFLCPIDLQSDKFVSFPEASSSVLGPIVINDAKNFVCFSNETGGYHPSPTSISAPMIKSLYTIAPLKQHFEQRQGLTIETWITPTNSKTFKYHPILTIGRPDRNSGRTPTPSNACHDYDLQLSQFGSYLRLSYTSAVGTCESDIFTTATLTEAVLTHLVVSFTATSTQVFMQGNTVSTSITKDFLNPQLTNWNASYGMQLFSDYVPRLFDTPNAADLVFQGAIHTIKLYDYGLNAEDITILYQAGLLRPSHNNNVDADGSSHLGTDNSTIVVPQTSTNISSADSNEGATMEGAEDTPTVLKPSELLVPETIFLTGKETWLGLPEYVINGIHLNNEVDLVEKYVRVDLQIVGESGTLHIKEEHLGLAVDFAKCSVRPYSDWKCHGDGSGRSITFIAQLSDVQSILTNLTFVPFFANTGKEDQLLVRIYEGEGVDCLAAEEHKLYGKISQSFIQPPHCTLVQGSIRIPVPSDTAFLFDVEDEMDVDETDDMSWFEKAKFWISDDFAPFLLGYIFYIAVVGVSAMILVLFWYYHHHIRGKKQATLLPEILGNENEIKMDATGKVFDEEEPAVDSIEKAHNDDQKNEVYAEMAVKQNIDSDVEGSGDISMAAFFQ